MTLTVDRFDSTPLQAYQGDTESYIFNAVKDGAAFNLTGFTGTLRIKRKITDAAELHTIALYVSLSDLSEGVVAFVIDSDITQTMSGKYVYDVQVTDTYTYYTLAAGTLEVKRAVSPLGPIS